MGISIRDAFFIELDTYFELLDLFNGANSEEREASQGDIDKFLM